MHTKLAMLLSPLNPLQGGNPGRGRLALVLIDLHEKDRGAFTYEHGTLDEGIARTARVVSAAREMRLPLVFVSGSGGILPDVMEAAGGEALFVRKTRLSAFSSADFETILSAHDAETLIVGGWIRHICVRATIADALQRGFRVATSDEILFGNREMQNQHARRACLAYFSERCLLYETSDDLVEKLRLHPDPPLPL